MKRKVIVLETDTNVERIKVFILDSLKSKWCDRDEFLSDYEQVPTIMCDTCVGKGCDNCYNLGHRPKTEEEVKRTHQWLKDQGYLK